MNYKAVLLDIDGTLIPIGSTGVSRRVVDCVARLRAAGIRVIVATGRSGFVLTPSLLGEFAADYYICVNGGLVLDAAKQPIRETRFTAEEMRRLNVLSAQQKLILGYVFEDGYYMYRGYRELLDFVSGLSPKESPIDPVGEGPLDGWVLDGSAQNRHERSMPYGAVLHGVPEGTALPADAGLSFVMFHPGSYDIYRDDLDKARAAEELLTSLGISMTETVAIGDGNNDVPMLAAAGLGVAMGNARPAAKQAANRVTDTVENDGVAVALEEIFAPLCKAYIP